VILPLIRLTAVIVRPRRPGTAEWVWAFPYLIARRATGTRTSLRQSVLAFWPGWPGAPYDIDCADLLIYGAPRLW